MSAKAGSATPRCSLGKVTGFMEATREVPTRRPVEERVNDYREVYREFPEQKLQARRRRAAWIAAFPSATRAAP
jgi:hypothetical protein